MTSTRAALPASEPQKWAWLVAMPALSISGGLLTHIDHSTVWFGVGILVAMAGGAAWQILYRRDLADRLLLLSWLAVIGAVVALVPGAIGVDEPIRFAALGGLIAGLVLAEQWLRRRDREA